MLCGVRSEHDNSCSYLLWVKCQARNCCRGATPKDYRVLPKRIILVRHAESEGNIDNLAYTYVPDPQVPLVSITTAFFVEQSYDDNHLALGCKTRAGPNAMPFGLCWKSDQCPIPDIRAYLYQRTLLFYTILLHRSHSLLKIIIPSILP